MHRFWQPPGLELCYQKVPSSMFYLQDVLPDMNTGGGAQYVFWHSSGGLYSRRGFSSPHMRVQTHPCSHLRVCTNVFLCIYAGSPVVAVVTHH